MPKRSNLPPPALMTSRGRPSTSRPRDPVTRLAFFCQILALGLVAGAFYLNFPNSLHRPKGPEVTLDRFPDLLEKSAVIAVHTRVPWITLAILSLLVAGLNFRTRFNPRPTRWITWSPLAVVFIIIVHATAQLILQSHGPLSFEFRGPAPIEITDALRDLPTNITITGTNSQPAIQAHTITRLTIAEGTSTQWQLLLGGDILFAVPLLFAWFLAFARPKPAAITAQP